MSILFLGLRLLKACIAPCLQFVINSFVVADFLFKKMTLNACYRSGKDTQKCGVTNERWKIFLGHTQPGSALQSLEKDRELLLAT